MLARLPQLGFKLTNESISRPASPSREGPLESLLFLVTVAGLCYLMSMSKPLAGNLVCLLSPYSAETDTHEKPSGASV
jgi:hypothetical protein